MKLDRPTMRRMAILIVALSATIAAPALGGAVVPPPVATLTGLPQPSENSFFLGVRYHSNGLLYINDGIGIWRQAGINASQFERIGEISGVPDDAGNGAYPNSSDAGPINFSQDGTRLLVGNGAGGWQIYFGQEWHNGRLFSMPVEGATVSVPVGDIDWHYDFVPVSTNSHIADSASKHFVNHGVADYMTDAKSFITVFDEGTGEDQIVVSNVPGASASIAVDAAGNLFACNGYGDTRGLIKRFDADLVDAAYESGTPVDWASGTPLNPYNYNNNSGAGMFFDARGYLYAGGNEGLTVFRPDGTSETYDLGAGSYCSFAYNPALDQILAMLYGTTFLVYNAAGFLPGEFPAPVPEPSTLVLLGLGASVLVWHRRRRSQGLSRNVRISVRR